MLNPPTHTHPHPPTHTHTHTRTHTHTPLPHTLLKTYSKCSIYAPDALVDQRATSIFLDLPPIVTENIAKSTKIEGGNMLQFYAEGVFRVVICVKGPDDVDMLGFRMHGRSITKDCISGVHQLTDTTCRVEINVTRSMRTPHPVSVRHEGLYYVSTTSLINQTNMLCYSSSCITTLLITVNGGL